MFKQKYNSQILTLKHYIKKQIKPDLNISKNTEKCTLSLKLAKKTPQNHKSRQQQLHFNNEKI